MNFLSSYNSDLNIKERLDWTVIQCWSYVDKPIVYYLSPARCLNMKDKKSRKFFFVCIQTEFKPFNFSLLIYPGSSSKVQKIKLSLSSINSLTISSLHLTVPAANKEMHFYCSSYKLFFISFINCTFVSIKFSCSYTDKWHK